MKQRLGTKLAKLLSVDDEHFKVRVRFSDGFIGTVNLAPFFEHPKNLVAEVLRGGMFKMCFVEHGALAWPNGLELCPDALRRMIPPAKMPATRKPKTARSNVGSRV